MLAADNGVVPVGRTLRPESRIVSAVVTEERSISKEKLAAFGAGLIGHQRIYIPLELTVTGESVSNSQPAGRLKV